jgi:hypothetical protein
MRQRLTSRTFSDFAVLPSGITQVNYVRSLAGKVNIPEYLSTAQANCYLSLRQKTSAVEPSATLSVNIRRGLTSSIETSALDIPAIAALRRRNLPLPPSGYVTILRSSQGSNGEEKLSGNTLVAGDTHILLLTAWGDFPATPEIAFGLYDTTGKLIVKSNLTTQADISVENIAPANAENTQKLTAQIVLYPDDTNSFKSPKTLLYKVEIADKLADEVYTIESGKVTVKPDILDYFSMR